MLLSGLDYTLQECILIPERHAAAARAARSNDNKRRRIMAAKRRLTLSIREDIHIHLMRETGTGQKQKEALQAFREYVVKCWIEWASGVYDAHAETLPECCTTTSPSERIDFSKFYAGMGDWMDPAKFCEMDIGTFKRVNGTSVRAFNSRHMTTLQRLTVKTMGRAYDKAIEVHTKLAQDLDSVLQSNTTVEGLMDDLPQCEPFAKQFLNPKKDQHTALLIPGAHARIRKALKA